MPAPNRTHLARDVFTAFAAGDRERIEALLAPSLTFHAPPDPTSIAPATSRDAGQDRGTGACSTSSG
jgi:ketosteroid isomerase-like protein